mmetsp:Transcript_5311/g.13413  ORF Transcript_5311/g.13413 Transcript_5311/m.13413 type:complete len:279 (-) Transcript_5311:438-1274(-)
MAMRRSEEKELSRKCKGRLYRRWCGHAARFRWHSFRKDAVPLARRSRGDERIRRRDLNSLCAVVRSASAKNAEYAASIFLLLVLRRRIIERRNAGHGSWRPHELPSILSALPIVASLFIILEECPYVESDGIPNDRISDWIRDAQRRERVVRSGIRGEDSRPAESVKNGSLVASHAASRRHVVRGHGEECWLRHPGCVTVGNVHDARHACRKAKRARLVSFLLQDGYSTDDRVLAETMPTERHAFRVSETALNDRLVRADNATHTCVAGTYSRNSLLS